MPHYYNAEQLLPCDLLAAVLKHIPERSRSCAVLYFQEDYYLKRNAEIMMQFRTYQADPHFGSTLEICEALAEQYKLSVRNIERIVQGAGVPGGRHRRGMRRASGVRVGPRSRCMYLAGARRV